MTPDTLDADLRNVLRRLAKTQDDFRLTLADEWQRFGTVWGIPVAIDAPLHVLTGALMRGLTA